MSIRPLLITTVAATTLLGALAASGRESAEESDYVGAAVCGQCHVAEYEAWRLSAHARALDSLNESERKDPRCRQCHSTTPDDPDAALAGVQCEACHGRGRFYSVRPVMRDPELRAALFFEPGGAATCGRCHNDSSPAIRPFEYSVKMALIRHPSQPSPAAPAEGAAPAPEGSKTAP